MYETSLTRHKHTRTLSQRNKMKSYMIDICLNMFLHVEFGQMAEGPCKKKTQEEYRLNDTHEYTYDCSIVY